MISKEKLLNGYIKNDIKQGGELFNKWREACLYYEFSYKWIGPRSIGTVLEDTEGCYIDRFEDFNGCGEIEAFLRLNPEYVELTFEDFEGVGELKELNERLEVTEESFTIPWEEAPDGYDYWIVATGDLLSEGSFHKKHGLTYEDTKGFYWETGYEGFQYEVYANPKLELLKRVQDAIRPLEEVSETSAAQNYKYTPVEVESIFDLREMFEKGELYFRWLGNPEKGSGGVGYDQITNENMLIYRYEEGRLLTRKEISWQDEVLAYLERPSEEGFEDELPSKFRVDYMNESFHLVDSEFLEMCRVALRANGELK